MRVHANRGFTLVELIAVIVLISVLSVTVFFRMGNVNSVNIQSGRDEVIAALFFAQQQAMMRSNITLVITPTTISVNESGSPIKLSNNYYPLAMPANVGVSTNIATNTFVYDKLGRTSAGTITLTGSGSSSGVSATVRVEASGYAY